MTDLITRARKEWCERHGNGGHKYVNVCPEEVVAALLEVLAAHSARITTPRELPVRRIPTPQIVPPFDRNPNVSRCRLHADGKLLV